MSDGFGGFSWFSANAEGAFEVARILTEATGSDLHEGMAFAGDFNDFAQTDALERTFEELP